MSGPSPAFLAFTGEAPLKLCKHAVCPGRHNTFLAFTGEAPLKQCPAARIVNALALSSPSPARPH